MDNLENIAASSVNLPDIIRHIEEFCYSDGLIGYVNRNKLYVCEEGFKKHVFESYTIDGICDKLKFVTYLSAEKLFFMATEEQLVLFNRITQESVIHNVQNKPILALSWNPAQTALVMIAVEYEISIFTLTNLVFHLKYSDHLIGEVPVPITVGWGSQTSQFQGPKKQKRAKELRTQTVEKLILNGPPKISWRNNGEEFVVNYCKNGNRHLKIFSSDLIAQSETDEYFNLAAPVSFRGEGQTVAAYAIKDKSNDIVIFEKNCKVKAVYHFKETAGIIKKILYHPEMNLLAVLSVDQDKFSYVNIYLFNNGHWYQKQQLFFPFGHEALDFQWVNLRKPPFTICKIVIFTLKNVETHLFRFILNRSEIMATVGVVDGKHLNVYKFDDAIAPSTMPVTIFENLKPINNVVFHPSEPQCMITDSWCCAKLLSFKDETIVEVKRTQIDIDVVKSILSLESVNFELCGGGMKIMQEIARDPVPKVKLPFNETPTPLPFKVLHKGISHLIYITQTVYSGTVYEFGLSSNRHLYVNERSVCGGVTSIKLFKKYFLFTHENSKLYCMRLRDSYMLNNKLDLSRLFSRDIEQGARIVQINNSVSPQMILQIPRGNFETINCKLITLDLIEQLLGENKWEEVFNIIRSEKVNWNVLIDLNPPRFVAKIEDFVKATKYRSMLKIIISEFTSDENVFETVYKNYLPYTPVKFDKKDIINKILDFLMSSDCVNNLGAIVALQQKHISLKSAIKSVKDVFEINPKKYEAVCLIVLREVLTTENFTDIVEVAYDLFSLQFLSFVFCTASTEDPRVYEPELEELQKLPPMEQKFQMSRKAQNFSGSVKYLLRCETYDDEFISKFIKEYKIEKDAYHVVDLSHKYFLLVSQLYATRLGIDQRHIESGVILKRAGLLSDALKSYKKALDWREVVALVKILNLGEEQRSNELHEMADLLLKAHKIDEAVIIWECHLKDYKKALTYLVENKEFRKAIALALTYDATEELENLVLPTLKDYMVALKEKLDDFKTKFEEHADRLHLVRECRKLKMNLTASGLVDDDDEIFSEAQSSIVSTLTRGTSRTQKTTMSAKNRRKEAKKIIDLKRGGYFEDIALIRALHILYGEVFRFGKDLHDVCLIKEHEDWEFCQTLLLNYKTLKSDMFDRISDIWSEVFLHSKREGADPETLAVVQNRAVLDPQFATPPVDFMLDPWHLEMF